MLAKTLITFKLSSQGFSLVEVVVAMGIIGIAIVANLTISSQTAKNFGNDSSTEIASELSANVLEDLMIRNSSDPLLTAGTHTQAYDINQQPIINGNGVFVVSWIVTLDNPIVSIMRIDETVLISTSNGSRSISLTSFRGE